VLALLSLAALLASLACHGSESVGSNDARGIVVVNAPSAGQVRRVLVREGMSVTAGTPIVEIAVQAEGAAAAVAPSPGESAESRAARGYNAADAEVEAARTEVVRHQAEVERLTPLVASGEASQGQLDGERALYDRAQQRLQQAQSAKRGAESGLLAARQPGQSNSAAPAAPREQLVQAVTPAAGTVSAVSARVGDRVTTGQPLATLRADQP
jgi:biotin carboxyl carrier protein